MIAPWLLLLATAATAGGASPGSEAPPKFYPDDPILVDNDRLPIEKPAVIELSPTYDMLEQTFAWKPPEPPLPRAMNVNTLDEVPDSSWFTNRIGVRDISIDELVRGPAHGGPPDAINTLTVFAGKQGGITPGFRVRDSRGNVYFIKFDPAEHPNLTTGADIISKNFFHAIGYNVPEAYIIYLRAERLEIEPGASVSLPGGKSAPLDETYVRSTLEAASKNPDGNTRAVASLLVPGDVLGPFEFHGTRSDDPNDIFPHEHRRELRGYRVFCAWLNHDDSRAINTLDTFIHEPSDPTRGHIRHYLIDFGSTLGSGSDNARRIAPQNPRAGNEYIIDLEATWKTAYTFGIWDREWRKIKYPYPRFAEAGRIEADYFRPEAWKPEYPSRAFDYMRDDDAFWAAKIVARFSDEAIRAIVKTGDYLSGDAEAYLADVLIKRRDKILAYYFRRLNPLDAFAIRAGRLSFANLGERYGLGQASAYEYRWFELDNATGETTPLGSPETTTSAAIPTPPSSTSATTATYLMVRIRTVSEDTPRWYLAVDVYTRGTEVVGIEREILP